MRLVVAVLALLLAGCSSAPSDAPDPPTDAPPSTWIGLQPGDARAYDGPGGELVLIYVDETYDFTDVDGEYASALTWQHGDDYTTDYFVEDEDGTLWWYGRKSEWRAGTDGEEPREIDTADGAARFGDLVITLGEDGPSQVETLDGVYLPA